MKHFLFLASLPFVGCAPFPQKPSLPFVSVAHPGSHSMFPREMGRAMFSVEPCPFENLKVNDMVCFFAKWVDPTIARGNVAIHRIVARDWRTGRLFVTQGDENKNVDPDLLTPTNYIGVAKLLGFKDDHGHWIRIVQK